MARFDLILNSGFRKEDFNVGSLQWTASYGKSSHGLLGNLVLDTKTMYNGYEYLICPRLTFLCDFCCLIFGQETIEFLTLSQILLG